MRPRPNPYFSSRRSRAVRQSAVLGLCALLGAVVAGCESEAELAANQLAAAREHHAQGDLRAAAIELKSALQREPDLADARLLLGQVALALGDVAAAEKELERAKTLGLDGRESGALLVQALIAQRKFTEALIEMRRLEVTADDTDWTEPLGSAHLGLGKYDEAEKVYARALERDAGSAIGLRGLIRANFLSGDTEAAERYIAQAVAAHPEDSETWVLKGELDFAERRLEAATEAYRRAHTLQPDELPPRIGLARTVLERGEEVPRAELDWLEARYAEDPRVAFILGQWAYGSGDVDAARRWLLKVLAAYPNFGEALEFLGNLHLDQQEYGQAEEYLRRYLARVPGDLSARMRLARVQIELNTPERAVDTLLPALADEEVEADVLDLLGVAFAGSGEIEKAQLVRAAAGDASVLVAAARSNGSDRAAEQDLDAAQADPVMALIAEGRFEEAVAAARELVEQFPDASDAHNLLGGALEFGGQLEESRGAYERAHELQPTWSAASLNLGRVATLTGDLGEARRHYERVLTSDRFNSAALLGLASIALDEGRSAEAIELLETARAYDASLIDARLILARYYLHNNAFDQALAAVEEAMRIAPERADVRLVAGQARMATGNAADSVAIFARLTEEDPRNVDAWFYLGTAQVAIGEFGNARRALSKVLELAPGHEFAATNLVNVELAAGRRERALEVARALAAASPEGARGSALEGRALVALGRSDEALDAYRRAFDIERRQDLLLELVNVHLAAGQQAEALTVLGNWLRDNPEDTTVLLGQANILYVAGRLDEATASLERVVELEPEAAGALNNLALVYHEAGNPEALSMAERAYRQTPDNPGVMDTYGWLLLELSEQTALAADLLRRARKGLPEDPSVLYHFAAALARTGDVEGAKAELRSLLADSKPFPERVKAQALQQTLDLM